MLTCFGPSPFLRPGCLFHRQQRRWLSEKYNNTRPDPVGSAFPQEIGELVAFLASDRASAIHSAEYVIDCGTSPTV